VEIDLAQKNLNQQGMVCDFLEVERSMLEFLETELDHRMLLREDDLLVKALQEIGEAPFVMRENPTAESIARLIFEEAERRNFPVVAVRLWETEDAVAEYRGRSLS
jgi:6-pyruvoyltetrahydropterin/6-carboxytetrahydropterin synthase